MNEAVHSRALSRALSWAQSETRRCMQDVTAGSCFQTNDLLDGGDFSTKMTSAEHQAFTQCGFNSMEGFELAENLECSVRA